MDKFADRYGAKPAEALEKLKELEPQISSIDDRAGYIAYQCSLARDSGQKHLIQGYLASLKQQLKDFPGQASLLAVQELCSMYSESDTAQAIRYVAKSYHFVKASESATLRYWIGLTYVEQTSAQGRARDAIEAAKIALEVARSNQDLYRQSVTLQLLASQELQSENPSGALSYIDEAIELNKKVFPNYVRTASLLNRAYILMKLGQLDQSMKEYREIERIAVRQKEDATLPIVWGNYADIEYALGNYEQAYREIERVLAWADKHQDDYTRSYAQLTSALLAVQERKLEQAYALKTSALRWFEKNQNRVEVADFYGRFAEALSRNGYHKQAYAILTERMKLLTEIDKESRGHAADELRELLRTEAREKENATLREQNSQQQAEVERSRLSTERWILLALLLLVVAGGAARFAWQVRRKNQDLLKLNQELDSQRYHDALTHLYNRRYFVHTSQEIWRRAEANRAAILIIDADHFKQVNDQYGHATGDAVLVEIANRIRKTVRDSDVVVRWGGEEFLVVCGGCDEAMARSMASRILAAMEAQALEVEGKVLRFSVSIGYSLLPLAWSQSDALDLDESIKMADACLYIAKKHGRHRAVGLEAIASIQRGRTRIFDELEDASTQGEVRLAEMVAGE